MGGILWGAQTVEQRCTEIHVACIGMIHCTKRVSGAVSSKGCIIWTGKNGPITWCSIWKIHGSWPWKLIHIRCSIAAWTTMNPFIGMVGHFWLMTCRWLSTYKVATRSTLSWSRQLLCFWWSMLWNTGGLVLNRAASMTTCRARTGPRKFSYLWSYI